MNFKKTSQLILATTVVLTAILSVGFSLNNAKNKKIELIEFKAIYSDVTNYGFSVQFMFENTVYSTYILNGQIQTPGDSNRLKEIGFATGVNGEKYAIFERDGYSIDKFIVVQDDGFMNPAVIYIAVTQKTHTLENMTESYMLIN